VEAADVTGPLVQFQAAKFTKDEIKRVIRMMNAELGETSLASDVLDSVFEMWWPKLDADVSAIVNKAVKPTVGAQRSERELLEEVLELTRIAARGRMPARRDPAGLTDLALTYRRAAEVAIASGADQKLVAALANLGRPVQYLVGHDSDSVRTRWRHEVSQARKMLGIALGPAEQEQGEEPDDERI
jgi:hypothetical protein